MKNHKFLALALTFGASTIDALNLSGFENRREPLSTIKMEIRQDSSRSLWLQLKRQKHLWLSKLRLRQKLQLLSLLLRPGNHLFLKPQLQVRVPNKNQHWVLQNPRLKFREWYQVLFLHLHHCLHLQRQLTLHPKIHLNRKHLQTQHLLKLAVITSRALPQIWIPRQSRLLQLSPQCQGQIPSNQLQKLDWELELHLPSSYSSPADTVSEGPV